jgi:lipoprotein signal peptidase
VIVVVVLLTWLWRSRTLSTALAVGAITGGAIGNIISRERYGAVVDFIDAHIGAWHWYVFNIADAAIVCGVATLILESMAAGRGQGRAALAEPLPVEPRPGAPLPGAPLPAARANDKEAP